MIWTVIDIPTDIFNSRAKFSYIDVPVHDRETGEVKRHTSSQTLWEGGSQKFVVSNVMIATNCVHGLGVFYYVMDDDEQIAMLGFLDPSDKFTRYIKGVITAFMKRYLNTL